MKLYVGNLDSTIDDAELQKIFSTHGTVQSATVVIDKFSGVSRGFGFVEMPDVEASNAIKALDGQQHGRSTLRVNEARPQNGGPKRFGANNGGNRSSSGGRREGGRSGWKGGRY